MDLNSDAWRNLIFEGRNKSFGAYYLRKTSSKRHLHALLIVIGTVIVISILLLLFMRLRWDTEDIDLKPIDISNLIVMSEYNYEAPETPVEENLTKKNTSTSTLQIVEEDTIIEPLNEIKKADLLSDLIDAVPSDSVFFEKFESQDNSESIKVATDPMAQKLNQTDSISEIQALQAAMLRYVYQNLKYPDVAYKQKIQGNVIYSFTLNQDGSLSNIELVEGTYIFLDEEALRVIRSMPVWQPIKKDGKPIRIKCYLPIKFSL